MVGRFAGRSAGGFFLANLQAYQAPLNGGFLIKINGVFRVTDTVIDAKFPNYRNAGHISV